jgi:hypothetical protein
LKWLLLSPDHWIINGLSNALSDALFLDAFAEWAWTMGNYCLPPSERIWAGVKALATIALLCFGGEVMGKVLGKAGAALFERIPCNGLTKWIGKTCFVAGTPVHTKEGLKPIEEIKVGDEVLSYDQQTKRTEYKPVTQTYIKQATSLVAVTVAGETAPIVATPEHPFLIRRARDGLASGDDDGEWKAAGELQVGAEVLRPDGSWVGVVALDRRAEAATVYNFEVEDNHDYFVGQRGALVHNQCGLNPYEVGTLEDLASRSRIGDGLDLHHVVQKNPAAQVIPGFNPRTSAVIALPKAEHALIPNLRGVYQGTARQLLERDIGNLQSLTNAPASAIDQLINLNHSLFPGVF